MKKAGKKAYMSRIVVLAGVIAVLCAGGEKVCFGLLNEPWPNPADAVWWSGAKVGEPNYWMTPSNWNQGQVPRDTNFVGYNFAVPPDGVGQSGAAPGYTGDPNIVIIRAGEVAECNYLRLGGAQPYVNLVVRGTLNVGGGPSTWRGLRISSWTNWQKNKVIIDGGKLTVNGDTDQSNMIVISGDVNVAGQIGLGAGANGNEYWSDQYYLTITNGTVRAGDFVMANVGSVSGKLRTDINGPGQLIIKGDVTARLAGYKSNGWMTAYGGSDPNHVVSVAIDANGDTVVTAGLVSAARADINSPVDGTTVPWEDPNKKGYGPTLTWKAGVGATSHMVYFGSTFTDVNNANQSSSQYKGNQVLANKSYTVSLADINLGQSYFWRVDENDAGSIVKGYVWQFSILSYRVVDEFETYVNDGGLKAVWGDSYENGTNSSITLEAATVQGGLQALNISYSNNYSPYISEANMLCSALPGCPNDWTAAGVKILTLSLHGNTSIADKVYVMLKSKSNGGSGIVYYPDMNELRQNSWEWYRFWAIDLAQFSSQGVDLHNVTEFVIGVGNKASPAAGGYGVILADTIRLQPATCLGRAGDADLNNDCAVDLLDLEILADNWLAGSTVVTASAPTVGPVLWYPFNEGANYDVHDSSGHSYTAYLNAADWGGAGSGYDGSNCINLSNEAYIEVPLAAFDANWGAECTFSLWFKDPGQDDNDGMLFQLGRGDAFNRGPQVWTSSNGFMEWACGYDPNTTYRDFLWFGQNPNYGNPVHPLNKWVHYAFVKSYSAGYMRVYQDGMIVAELTNVSGNKLDNAVADGNTFFTIGAWRWSGGAGGFCNGLIDDFRVYNYALSPAQVLSLAVAGGTATSPMTQPLLTPANAVADNRVDFKDYALMANKWRQQALFP